MTMKICHVYIQDSASASRLNDLFNEEFECSIINTYDDTEKQNIGKIIIYGLLKTDEYKNEPKLTATK